MERAPNVSIEDLPSHMRNHFLERFNQEDLQLVNKANEQMMADQAPEDEEDEEEAKSFKTNVVHVFSTNRK